MTSRRRFLSAAAVTGLAATLAACSNGIPQVSAPSGTPSPYPVLDADRLTEVLTRIGSTLETADAAKDGDALKGYLTGPALEMRKAEYAVATAANDNALIHVFSTTSQAGAVGLSTGFPRTALVVTEATSATDSPYLLALSQEEARDPFELWGWVRLFSGVQVPATSIASVGSEQIDAESTGLVATPQTVLENYVDALNNPEGENGTAFANDTLRQRIASEKAVDLGGMGTVSVSAEVGDDGFRGLRTADGGAIVMTTLRFSTVYTKTTAGANLNVGGNVGALLGDQAVRGTVTAVYDAIVAFSIPAQGVGGQPVALGADIVLASTSRDDSTEPQQS